MYSPGCIGYASGRYGYLVFPTLCLGRQWFEETVVVRKEGDGYGITLAEAQPVFIQRTVKNGPADKAGVQVGDRIVKVPIGLCLYLCAYVSMPVNVCVTICMHLDVYTHMYVYV